MAWGGYTLLRLKFMRSYTFIQKRDEYIRQTWTSLIWEWTAEGKGQNFEMKGKLRSSSLRIWGWLNGAYLITSGGGVVIVSHNGFWYLICVANILYLFTNLVQAGMQGKQGDICNVQSTPEKWAVNTAARLSEVQRDLEHIRKDGFDFGGCASSHLQAI